MKETIKLHEKVKKIEKKEEMFLSQIGILEKYSSRPPEDEEELEELFSVLCFNNLGFCCKPSMKPCLWRSAVLKILDISNDEFTKRKEKFGKEMGDIL